LNVSEDLLEDIQRNLQALKDFLDQNPQLFHSAPGDHAGARAAPAPEQDAWRVIDSIGPVHVLFAHAETQLEQQSVSQLQRLLGRTTEAISFVLLLHDHRMGEIIKQ
jgi:nuclear pore complex protein Nup155